MSETTTGVILTEPAVAKLKQFIEAEVSENPLRLRLYVEPGGCSGLRYQFFFDEDLAETDNITTFDGVEVVIDNKSMPYLDGASIDYEDTISKQGFVIDNPNAQGTCACGDSFN